MKKPRLALTRDNEEIFIADPSVDKHTKHGFFTVKDLKKKSGSKVKTNTGVEFVLVDATFKDKYNRLHRHAQIITPKDIGFIITETGINKKSIIIDAGTGSGALACYLAAIAKKVISYDQDERSIDTGNKNKKTLGLKNLTIKKADATSPKAFNEKNVDVIVLDLPEPWNALDNAIAALKPGGFIACYSPHATQALETSNTAQKKGLVVLKTVELIQREWVVEERKCRPDFRGLGHTGFLTFLRKL